MCRIQVYSLGSLDSTLAQPLNGWMTLARLHVSWDLLQSVKSESRGPLTALPAPQEMMCGECPVDMRSKVGSSGHYPQAECPSQHP